MRVTSIPLAIGFFLFFDCIGQPAKIEFRVPSKVESTVTGISDIQLFTEAGTYGLHEIRKISFWQAEPDSLTILMMRQNGITVFLRKQMLSPLGRKDSEPEIATPLSVGLGLGLDYGVIGIRFSALTNRRIGLFGALGAEYNVGIDIKFQPRKLSSGFVTAMYGYHGALTSYGTTVRYHGFSAGLGVRVRAARSARNYFTLCVIVPFRSDEFKRLANPSELNALPVLLSLGFNFGVAPK